MAWRKLSTIFGALRELTSRFSQEKKDPVSFWKHRRTNPSIFQEPVFLAGFMNWQSMTFIEAKELSSDSKMFIFSLGDPNLQLGCPIGNSIAFRANLPTKAHPEGEIIMRAYTPTSKIDQRGTIEIPIKIYNKNANPNFPDGGIMTQYLDTLKPGDKVEVCGPKGKLTYFGDGNMDIKGKNYKIKNIGFVAGGSGITPCFQLIQYIIDNNEDVNLSLIYANRTENDILLRDKLDEYAQTGKLTLHYTLDTPSETWKYGRGFVTREMLERYLPAPSSDTLIFFCGPDPMNKMLITNLEGLGYSSNNLLKY
ncbi:unnamed protein product [Blepharisma stoltei]|uniref:NADH-cytochrome b5 reductase n=1 Tax=Blepharisma stoltei TaxID=1481888 RepID=A0AAU9JHR8_9CILI|nr:unnamed protein product [Blepharisma stoltei]